MYYFPISNLLGFDFRHVCFPMNLQHAVTSHHAITSRPLEFDCGKLWGLELGFEHVTHICFFKSRTPMYIHLHWNFLEQVGLQQIVFHSASLLFLSLSLSLSLSLWLWLWLLLLLLFLFLFFLFLFFSLSCSCLCSCLCSEKWIWRGQPAQGSFSCGSS